MPAAPRTDAPGFAPELLDAPGLSGTQARLRTINIGLLVALEHALPGGVHLLRLVLAKSARVPLRSLEALLGSLTPWMANISRPIRPCAA